MDLPKEPSAKPCGTPPSQDILEHHSSQRSGTLIHVMLVLLRTCSLIVLAVISDLQHMSLPRVCVTHQHFSYILLYLPLWVNLFLCLHKSNNTAHCYDYIEIKPSVFFFLTAAMLALHLCFSAGSQMPC